MVSLMPMTFPQLSAPLRRMQVFLSAEPSDELRAFFHKPEVHVSRRVFIDPEGTEDGRWLRIVTGAMPDRIWWRFEISRRKTSVGTVLPDMTPLAGLLRALNGETAAVYFDSDFDIANSAVPAKSFFRLFSGIEFKFDGMGAAMRGARLTLTNSIFREIQWNLYSTKDGEQLTVELEGTKTMAISDGIFADIEFELMQGFSRFLGHEKGGETRS